MRIDKYLKVSRLIKRRTVACEACETGKVKINEKTAKPGTDVKENDIIEITFGEKTIKVKVTEITEHALKSDASNMYTQIQE